MDHRAFLQFRAGPVATGLLSSRAPVPLEWRLGRFPTHPSLVSLDLKEPSFFLFDSGTSSASRRAPALRQRTS